MSIDVDLAVYVNPIVALLSDDFFGDRWKPESANCSHGRLLNESVRRTGNYLHRTDVAAAIEMKAELQRASQLRKVLR
jgi:hypothetical protein